MQEAPEPRVSRRKNRKRIPRSLNRYDGTLLALFLLCAVSGVVAFGAVRFWLSGPLIVLVFLGLFLFSLRPVFFPDIRRIHVPPGFLWAGLFLVYAAVRIPFSASPYEARIEWLALFSCLGAYAALSDVAGAGRRWKPVLGCVLFLITLIAWYMIIQHARGSRLVLMLERPEGYGLRASGTYHCPNHVAQILALGMTVGLALVLTPGAGTFLRFLGGYALLVPAYPLALTQSRSGLIGAAVGLSVTSLLVAWRRSIRAVVLVLVILPLLLGAAGWGLWSFSPGNRERIQKAMQFDGAGRLVMWKNTLQLIRNRPLFGYGGNNYRYVQDTHQTYAGTHRARYAHNEFLHVTADYGFVGLGLLSLFFGVGIVRILSRIRKMKRDRNASLAAGLMGVLAGMLAHNFFDFTFHLYANALLLAVIGGTIVSVLFASGALTPRFPPRRAGRGLSAALAIVFLGASIWTGLSLASALLVFPARKAEARMEDRRAEELYRLAMRFDPGSWKPVLELATLIRQQAFWNPIPERKEALAREAEALYRACLEINPWRHDARYGLSVLYGWADKPEKALEELKTVIRMSPRHAFYHAEIGRQLRRMGEEREALKAFRTALSLNPRDEKVRAHIRSLRRRGID